MITPSLESTSYSSAGIFETVPPSVLSRGNFPLLPFVSAFSGKQPRGGSFDRLVPDLPPGDFIKHALSVVVHPMARPCPLPTRLVNTIVTAAKLADNLVAHRWKLFETFLTKHHELAAARKAWRASLSGDSLALFGSWDFFLFQRLMDEAGYEDKYLLHDISCLPLIGPAPVSGVLSPKSVNATVSLSEFWSKVPQRIVQVFNRVGPTGDTELDRRASDKTHEEFALGLMDGPYNSLEECPGQHKVLVRREPRWQSGDVRNIGDCSENGINDAFESKETYKPAGVDHHVSAIKQWEASLPGVKLHGFVADLWKHFRQIGIGLNLIVVFWCHKSGSRRFGRLRGCPFGAAAVSKVVLAFLWQCAHFCITICSFLCSTIKMIITAWSHSLFGPKLASPGGDKFPLPSQVYRLLGTKVDSLSHRVKFKSFPRESIQSVLSSNRSFRPEN